MSAPRPIEVFVMITDRGHIWPDSARNYRKYVVAWADKIWARDGGYQCARKQGWRIIKVLMTPLPEGGNG